MRLFALLLLAAASAPAFAQRLGDHPGAARPARRPSRPAAGGGVRGRHEEADCRRGALADAIVVCGRRRERGAGYRIPLASPSPAHRRTR